MQVYRISATKGNISFTQTIKADSYLHAKNKFMLNNRKYVFPDVQPELIINSITRRY